MVLYLAISPSAINPHRCALEASTLSWLPQVGIQLGAGAISFSATACPPQSFMKKEKKKKYWSSPAGENSRLLGNIKTREEEETQKKMSTKMEKKTLSNAIRGDKRGL